MLLFSIQNYGMSMCMMSGGTVKSFITSLEHTFGVAFACTCTMDKACQVKLTDRIYLIE